jgi:hypothetical protein
VKLQHVCQKRFYYFHNFREITICHTRFHHFQKSRETVRSYSDLWQFRKFSLKIVKIFAKLTYCEKATKLEKIWHLFRHLLSKVKTSWISFFKSFWPSNKSSYSILKIGLKIVEKSYHRHDHISICPEYICRCYIWIRILNIVDSVRNRSRHSHQCCLHNRFQNHTAIVWKCQNMKIIV